MSSERHTLQSVQDDIIAAISDLRAVARAENDERRNHTADWLDGLFGCALGADDLREAAAKALTLHGGAGSYAVFH
jgi:NAD(P)H-hydrate repair Nnr-like enzyme with NAD(P)H-hydrate dehydratase domain